MLYTPNCGSDGTVVKLVAGSQGGHYESGTLVKTGAGLSYDPYLLKLARNSTANSFEWGDDEEGY